jgi:vancomycin resistance protein YoaR
LTKLNLTRKIRRSSWVTWILIALGVVIALCVLAILIDAGVYYNKIHAGVSISGHSMGGLTRDEAVAEVTKLVDGSQSDRILLTSPKKNWPVMPDVAGTQVDAAGTVAAAMDVSRSGNFITSIGHRFRLFFHHVDVPIKGTVDSAKMDALIASVAKVLDVPAVNAGLTIKDGKITVIEDKPGTVVDRDKLRQQLKALLFSFHATELPVPMKVDTPAVVAQDTQKAVDEAKTMISADVVLQGDSQSWTLTPDQIVSFMDVTDTTDGGVSTLVPVISAAKMKDFLDSITPDVATKPTDATFKVNGDSVSVVPSVDGTALDPEKTADAIATAALQTVDRTAQVQLTTSPADLTTEEAQSMGIVEKISSYTTPEYVGTSNRQHNVRITTEYASNVILAPGEEYNFDKQIGPRTAARGYLTAPGIVGPGKLEDVFGGGICQVSTTLFNAVFFAGLKVTERHNHSLYISHYPQGRDATVSAGGPNLRWVNDTDNYILVMGTSNGIKTTFTLYGTNPHRKVTYTTSGFYNVVPKTTVTTLDPTLGPGTTVVETSGQQGMQCKVVRTVLNADGSVRFTNNFISTYTMVPKTIGVSTVSSTTTTTVPGESTSTTGHTTTTGESSTTTNF